MNIFRAVKSFFTAAKALAHQGALVEWDDAISLIPDYDLDEWIRKPEWIQHIIQEHPYWQILLVLHHGDEKKAQYQLEEDWDGEFLRRSTFTYPNTVTRQQADTLTPRVRRPMNVHLTPLSPKAKNRLANSLGGNPIVSLEQLRDGEIFVVSNDRQFCTWIKTKGDPDWGFAFTRESAAAAPGSQPL